MFDENCAFSFMQKISPILGGRNFFSCLQLKELNITCIQQINKDAYNIHTKYNMQQHIVEKGGQTPFFRSAPSPFLRFTLSRNPRCSHLL